MVNPALIIAAAIFVGVIFIRKEIGETGVELGRAATGIGLGLGTLGRGIQTFVSSILSPRIRPELVPTLGLKLELPYGIGGSSGPIGGGDDDDRQGGRNINVGSVGRQGLPPTPMIAGGRRRLTDRAGARPEGFTPMDLREAQLRGGFFK